MTLVLVFLGAAVGAPLRYLADRAVQSRHDSVFPWGTLSVNVVGCLLLGGLLGAGAALPGWLAALLGAGLSGSLTTFSTFSYETVRLAEGGAYFYALANILVSVIAGIGAALLGHAVISALV
ncbi:MAG: fluoride efflux transporter CrcB [Pseudonocardiaceae bacterium]|nr:fluoride efflux transporter CrcB [Pseudonocardiaceae bacterium]